MERHVEQADHVRWHRAGVFASVLGVLFVFCALTIDATAGVVETQVVDLHNDSADKGSKDDCPRDGRAYWHFVLAPNDGTFEFVSIHLAIGGSNVTYDADDLVLNAGQLDNVFVPVPAGASLDDLRRRGSFAEVTPAGTVKFVLSHVCPARGGGTTTTTTTKPHSTTTTTYPGTTTTTVKSYPPTSTTTTSTTSTTMPGTTTTTVKSHPPTSTTTTTMPGTTTTTVKSHPPTSTTTTSTTSTTMPGTTTTTMPGTTTTTSTTMPGTTTTTMPGTTTTTSTTLPGTTTTTTSTTLPGTTTTTTIVDQRPATTTTTTTVKATTTTTTVRATTTTTVPRTIVVSGSDWPQVLILVGTMLILAGAAMVVRSRPPDEPI